MTRLPEKRYVRERWYDVIDESNKDRSAALKEVRRMFDEFVGVFSKPDRSVFKDMEDAGWRGIGDIGILFCGGVYGSNIRIFSEIVREKKVIVAANMVSGMPYAAAIISYLKEKNCEADPAFLSYSTRHSITFSNGSSMENKVYIPESELMVLENNLKKAIVIADDTVGTLNSMNSIGDALKRIGIERIFRTSLADLSLNRMINIWYGNLRIFIWNERECRWETKETPSENLRDDTGNFRNEKKFG